jgi:Fe-S cluster assembly scaffold protein SufB
LRLKYHEPLSSCAYHLNLRRYSVVPVGDNYFSALNAAVFSDGRASQILPATSYDSIQLFVRLRPSGWEIFRFDQLIDTAKQRSVYSGAVSRCQSCHS